MNKRALSQLICLIAEALRPYASSRTIGRVEWDGKSPWNRKKYVTVTTTKSMDPYAMAWCARLDTMAIMTNFQDGPLSAKQLEYLYLTLLGGMGSFSEFQLDEKEFGEDAKAANDILDRLRHELDRVLSVGKG